MDKQTKGEESKPWVVRDVPENTRRQVKAYAAECGITMAQALEFLIDTALRFPELLRVRWNSGRAYFKYANLPIPSDAEVASLLSRAAEISQQQENQEEVDTFGLDMAALLSAGLILPESEKIG